MSLLTRCPACTTIYKVVPDQLRISQGWVKCGQCGDIFDAAQHFVQLPLALDGQALNPPADTAEVTDAYEPPEENAPSAFDAAQVEQMQVAEEEIAPEAEKNLAMALDVEAEVEATEALTGLLPDPDLETDEVSVQPVIDALPESQESDAAPVSFLQDAAGRSFWHRPLVRSVLSLLTVALGLGLAGQWLYQERELLSAIRPDWKPAFEKFCDLVGCTIGPLQRIESIAIDSAAFNKVSGDRYQLKFALKNTSTLALALPSVELVLTDFQDRVVVRRVLPFQTFSLSSDRIQPGSELVITLPVSLKTVVPEQAVVGYRLLAFYP